MCACMDVCLRACVHVCVFISVLVYNTMQYNDSIITTAQALMKQKVPSVGGLQPPCFGQLHVCIQN